MSRSKQRIGGFIFTIMGAGMTAWNWNMALRDGYFYIKASMFFPAFWVIGLGLIFFPGYREERIARGEDISKLEGLKLITVRWWVIGVFALIVGLGNFLLMSSF